MANFDDLVRDRIRTDPEFAVMLCERLSKELKEADALLWKKSLAVKELKTKLRSMLKSLSEATR